MSKHKWMRPIKSYLGSVYDQMPRLRADGRIPLTPRELMLEQLADTVEGRSLRDHDVTVAALYVLDSGASMNAKVALYSNPIAKSIIDSICPSSDRYNHGGLVVDVDVYASLNDDSTVLNIPSPVVSELFDYPYSNEAYRSHLEYFLAEKDNDTLVSYKHLVSECSCNVLEILGFSTSISDGASLLRFGRLGNYIAEFQVPFDDQVRLVGRFP